MEKLHTLSLAVVFLASGGCGTVLNLAGNFGTNETYPYGGTMLDAVGIHCGCSAVSAYDWGTGGPFNDDNFRLGVLGTVDLPFSVIGDTLTLPWTLYKYVQQQQRNARRSMEAEARQQ